MANAKHTKQVLGEAQEDIKSGDVGLDAGSGAAGVLVDPTPAPGAADGAVADESVAPVNHLFFLDGKFKETTSVLLVDQLREAGWMEIDDGWRATYEAEQEAEKQLRIEAKRKADSFAASEKARDDAAIQPPESNATDDIARMAAKTPEDRIARIEAILRGQGWAL